MYSREDLVGMLGGRFSAVRTSVRFLNLRPYPGGLRVAGTRAGRRLEKALGWHLYVEAEKAAGLTRGVAQISFTEKGRPAPETADSGRE